MRLFIAVEFPEDIRLALERDARTLRRVLRSGTLSRRENYHLTLVFLGETDRAGERRAAEAMEQCRTGSFPLVIGAPGRFRGREGDTIWRNVDGGEALLSLHEALTDALRERGFRPEERAYTPHLTLARRAVFGGGSSFGALRDQFSPLRCIADGMMLMLSERPGGVLTYTPRHRTPFYETDKLFDQGR
ncbi:MAG: RNA 2',3'-cyclic phosphodiesterase [Oscillospiraceae bacterium]|nr:RNA 2',3'-cyclic phosphodiesterase [Oscillospiraceae bacterium]